MRDYKTEIDHCSDPYTLRELLDEIDEVIELALQSPYESVAELRTTRNLELLLRYGEHKLTQLLG